MLTKTALNKLTQAVSSRIRQEVFRYNQKVSESVTEEDLRDQFLDKVNSVEGNWYGLDAWNILKTLYPPIFTELLSCLRDDRKLDRLDSPCNYNLHEIIRPEIERLTANIEEFDSESLLTEQLFEKIYPMLVEAKYIHFESEKFEPTFELTQSEEEVVFAPLKSEDLESDTMTFSGDNDAWEYENLSEEEYPTEPKINFDEGDWE